MTSRTAETYETLKGAILDGALRPRVRLKIDQLSASLNVSVGAVREALSRLTSDGLVVAEPQRGFEVSPISIRDLADLTSVRIDVEAKCLRRAIAVGTIQWESGIVGAHHALAKTPESTPDGRPTADWPQLHARFHDALVSACDSTWWLKLREQLFLQAERYRRLSAPYVKCERDVTGEHKLIAEATLNRNADRAAELLAGHLRRTADLLKASDAPFDDAVEAVRANPKGDSELPVLAVPEFARPQAG